MIRISRPVHTTAAMIAAAIVPQGIGGFVNAATISVGISLMAVSFTQ